MTSDDRSVRVLSTCVSILHFCVTPGPGLLHPPFIFHSPSVAPLAASCLAAPQDMHFLCVHIHRNCHLSSSVRGRSTCRGLSWPRQNAPECIVAGVSSCHVINSPFHVHSFPFRSSQKMLQPSLSPFRLLLCIPKIKMQIPERPSPKVHRSRRLRCSGTRNSLKI